jgi:hypothetical protein
MRWSAPPLSPPELVKGGALPPAPLSYETRLFKEDEAIYFNFLFYIHNNLDRIIQRFFF